ncbi:concanavalin A-like lectin/glucanase domain-containing protein, partial [Spinellus fusiger]
TRATSNKTLCRNHKVDFRKSLGGWFEEDGQKNLYELTSQGLRMKLFPPKKYIPKVDPSTKLPFNQFEGQGPTFNPPNLMQYGSFSASIKAASVGGAVTAIILIADNGDEIDYEFLGSKFISSNYFWDRELIMGVNGATHNVNGSIYSRFHTYSINWTPEKIEWSIDGTLVRTKLRSDTCATGVCKFPSHPARVQIGLWDGSSDPGTAQWAHGPIDWNKNKVISAYIKTLEVVCNTEYN